MVVRRVNADGPRRLSSFVVRPDGTAMGGSAMSRRTMTGVGLATVLALGFASAEAASPDPQASPLVFTSTTMPYTITLPPGWTALPPFEGEMRDLFEADGVQAEVNSRGAAPPGQTNRERVELRRAESIADQGCASDPADDETRTLGGSPAILWTRTCGDTYREVVATIYEGSGYALGVWASIGSEGLVRSSVDTLVGSFVFTDAPTGSDPTDLTAVEAQLQGTWQTEWAPVELVYATVRAAGLDPADGDPGWRDMIGNADSTRSGVRFADGNITLYSAVDGGPLETGWLGRYRLVDADTFEATEVGVLTPLVYDFTLGDGILVVDVVVDPWPQDLVAQTAIYETLPFTKVP
jgi:hypothetical protein